MAILGEHLEHYVAQQMLHSDQTSLQNVNIRAEQGRVTVRGEVESFREKLAIQKLVQSCPGVESINNLLTVVPGKTVADPSTIWHIRRQFNEVPGLDQGTISVEAQGGKVSLVGYVSTDSDRVQAADIAQGVAGVQEVNNLLLVNPDKVLANAAHGVEIQSALAQIIGMEDEQINVSVVDETAQLCGMVDAIWKKDAAEKTVRKFKILTVANDLIVDSK